MHQRRRFGATVPARSFALVCAMAAAATTGHLVAGPATPASAGRPAGDPPAHRFAAGYLDRDGSAACFGGTHQLTDSCSGHVVSLQSSSLDLDAYLCRYLEAIGEEAGPGDDVLETIALRRTSNWCPADCDADGLNDACAIRHRLIPDCNGNDRPDLCDIQGGASLDCNRDGVPDECQVAPCELEDKVIMMSISEPDKVTWHPERGYNSFNVHYGTLSHPGQSETDAADAAPGGIDRISGHWCDLRTVTLRDTLTPARGEAIFYLVTGNRLGAEDRASIDSNGAHRPDSIRCPARAGPLDVSVRTDRAIYAPGETVRIEVSLANLNPTGEIDLLFATRCTVTFRVEGLDGRGLYLDLHHRSCSYDDNRLTLRPGQIASYEFTWDQKDDRGRPVEHIANYVIRGMVLHHDPVPDGITGISIRP